MSTLVQRVLVPLTGPGLSRNGLFALAHGLSQTAAVFLVYKLVLEHVGLALFGVWSLLMAGSTLVRLCDVSGGGALARFVALASRPTCPFPARDYVQTVVISGLILNVGFGLILWLLAPLVLPLFIELADIPDAQRFVPWAIAVTVLTAIAYAPTSALDGAQRADLRSVVGIITAALFLAVSWVLTPRLGIVGFAIALLIQQAAILALGWAVLRRQVSGLSWIPKRWRQEIFWETTGYAFRLSAVGFLGLLFEPLSRFAMNYAGGPALVGLFDLASRIVKQLRMLVMAAAAPLSPAFAARPEFNEVEFRNILAKATQLSAVAAIVVALTALAAAPMASLFFFGEIVPHLITMSVALTAGWALNTLPIPYYFAAQGLGRLRWNMAGQAVVAASVIVGAYLTTPLTGFASLILAIAVGLTCGAIITLLGNAAAFNALDIVFRLRNWLIMALAAIIGACVSVWMIMV